MVLSHWWPPLSSIWECTVSDIVPRNECTVLENPDTNVCVEQSRRLPLICWVTDCRGGLSAAVASRTGCGGDTVSCERSLAPQAHPPRADGNLEAPNNEESCHTIERRASVLHALVYLCAGRASRGYVYNRCGLRSLSVFDTARRRAQTSRSVVCRLVPCRWPCKLSAH